MRRAFAALLICVFLALLGIWAWILFAPAIRETAARAMRPEFCEVNEFCDHAAPPPVELRPGEAVLGPGHRDHPLVLGAVGAAGAERIYPYDRVLGALPGMPNQPAANRLYLVRLRAGGEALVIVRDTFTQRHALLIRRGANLIAYRLGTDPDLSLRRFALLDPATGAGDTFELRQTPRSEAFTYVTFGPDSPEIRAQWFRSRRSTCGYGPLTAVPREWLRDYERICRR